VKKKRVNWQHARVKGRLPPQLVRCPGCSLHIYPQVKSCPHCGGELRVLHRKQLAALRKAQAAAEKLQKILERM
jgi:hypothetical protein